MHSGMDRYGLMNNGSNWLANIPVPVLIEQRCIDSILQFLNWSELLWMKYNLQYEWRRTNNMNEEEYSFSNYNQQI